MAHKTARCTCPADSKLVFLGHLKECPEVAVRECPLAIGDKIHGFVFGTFGRNHFDCVEVEAVGSDWVVTRSPERGYAEFVTGEDRLQYVKEARDERCPNDYCYFDGMWFDR